LISNLFLFCIFCIFCVFSWLSLVIITSEIDDSSMMYQLGLNTTHSLTHSLTRILSIALCCSSDYNVIYLGRISAMCSEWVNYPVM